MSLTYGKVCPVRPRYKWTLNSFTLQSIEDKVQSPVFSTTCLNLKYTWQLYLYPDGKRAEDKGYLSIFLYNRSNVNFTASVCFSILNKNNEVLTSSDTDEHEISKNKGWGLHQFVKYSTIRNDVLANNDTLVVICEIVFNDHSNDEETRRKELQQTKMDALRIREFDMQAQLMLDGKFSDVTFLIDGKTMKLHKCILAKSSPVFAEMLEVKVENSTIEIKDVKYEVFVELAWFAYVAKVKVIDEIAGDLLAAADKYKIDGLKVLCEMALCDQLSVDNVFESLRLAEIHGTEKLKTKAIEFIVASGQDIAEKAEFQRLPAEVLCRICRALMVNQNSE